MGGANSNSEPLAIRPATKADLDAITWIIMAGFPDDPGCPYKFPYRDQFPQDFWKWTRSEYEEYLDQPEKYATLVITAPVAIDGATVQQPISIGVWDMAPAVQPSGGDRGIYERRDANPQHMRAYAAAMTCGYERYFARYRNEQIHLWMLVTHPEFRRRGAATMLCNWGLKQANQSNRILTVMASPMGKALYRGLGYNILGSVTAHVEGEEENVLIDAMEKPIAYNTPACSPTTAGFQGAEREMFGHQATTEF